MDFDPSKLTPEQLAALAGKLAAPLKQAVTESIVAATVTQLEQKLAPLAKSMEEVVARIGKVEEGMKPSGDPKPGDKDGKKDEETPEYLKPILARLDAIDGEKQKAKDAEAAAAAEAATLEMVTKTLKAKRPNISAEQLLIVASDIAARGPKEESGVLTTLSELVEKKYKPMGYKIEPLLADADKEGAAKPAPGTPEAKKAELIESIRADAKASKL